ncbi:MAG: radical SAM protein [Candidatus Schekmanbacteria bacterium]|nr:radical SAM protein [Candidatus Schekmanbacteria bacterium]
MQLLDPWSEPLPAAWRQMEEVPSHKQIASIFLVPSCDMVCPFCAADTDLDTMAAAQARLLLRELRQRNIRNVVFGGGEPYLWPHNLHELCEFAQDLGHFVQVCTNGGTLPSDFAESRAVDRFVLPLEAMNPELHDRLRIWPRGGGRHHAAILTRLRQLTEAEKPFTISTVVTRSNIQEVEAIGRFLLCLAQSGARLHAWHLYRFIAVGRAGSRNAGAHAITSEEFSNACRLARASAPRVAIYGRMNMRRPSSVEYFWLQRGTLQIGSIAYDR